MSVSDKISPEGDRWLAAHCPRVVANPRLREIVGRLASAVGEHDALRAALCIEHATTPKIEPLTLAAIDRHTRRPINASGVVRTLHATYLRRP